MKEIFEKIVIDSAQKVAGGITDNILSHQQSEDLEDRKKNDKGKKRQEDFREQKDKEKAAFTDEDNSGRVHDISIVHAYIRNKRLIIMIVSSSLGLIFSLLVLALYKGELPQEILGIMAMIIGFFGTCMKSAYNSELGQFHKKSKNNKFSSEILKRFKR